MTTPAPTDPTPVGIARPDEQLAKSVLANLKRYDDLSFPPEDVQNILDLVWAVRQEALREAAERARKVGKAWRDDADTAAEKQDFRRANNASYVASGAEEAAAEIALMTEPGPKETTT